MERVECSSTSRGIDHLALFSLSLLTHGCTFSALTDSSTLAVRSNYEDKT